MAQLSARSVEGLAELLDSDDERVRLEVGKTILDLHLGHPTIQADISLHRAEVDDHIAALIEVARRRALEPILPEDVEAEISTSVPSAT